jgi:hypothetical protein
MNLVCFGNYTCGALLCDILNLESSRLGPHNNIASSKHNQGKIPLASTFTGKGFNLNAFNIKISPLLENNSFKNKWIGTHCWPGELDTSLFNNIINVTTESEKSRIYRYARIFYTMTAGLFPGNKKPQRPYDTKSWHQSYSHVQKDNVVNIEFEDVVEWKNNIEDLLLGYIGVEYVKHIHNRMKFWRSLNDFLYDDIKMNYATHDYHTSIYPLSM